MTAMGAEALIPRLAMALAIGLLVGIERGWRERDAPARSRTAGIRTYGISGLLGGLFAALTEALDSSSLLVAGTLGFSAVFAVFKLREARHDDDFSVTGVIAGIAVFALGALAVIGDYVAAAAAGTALAALLASRDVLHGLLQRLTWVELRSGLVLAAMTAIVLPLLPNRPIDPWGGFNPWEVWFFTVLTAAISFAGYVAVRLLGNARGLVLNALAGATISSTAVTIALGHIARSGNNLRLVTGAALLAAMVSILRVGAIIAVVEPSVLPVAGLAMAAAASTFGLSGLVLLIRRQQDATLSPPPHSPFELGQLLLFALVFAVVAMANAALAKDVGAAGLVATTAVSGALDVDVAVLSVLRLVGQTASVTTAAEAVLAALAVNAVVRLGMAAVSGPVRFWTPMALATLLAVAAGFATYRFL